MKNICYSLGRRFVVFVKNSENILSFIPLFLSVLLFSSYREYSGRGYSELYTDDEETFSFLTSPITKYALIIVVIELLIVGIYNLYDYGRERNEWGLTKKNVVDRFGEWEVGAFSTLVLIGFILFFISCLVLFAALTELVWSIPDIGPVIVILFLNPVSLFFEYHYGKEELYPKYLDYIDKHYHYEIVVNVNKPGELHKLLTRRQRRKVSDIVITGFINKDDIHYLRETTGYQTETIHNSSDYDNKIAGRLLDKEVSMRKLERAKLRNIDLSHASFVGKSSSYDKSLLVGYNFYFDRTKRLLKVSLPLGIKKLPSGCFRNSSVREVILPYGLEIICKGAFEDCAIRKISFPATLKTIESNAFYNCTFTETVFVPKGVEEIGEMAFH